MKKICIFILTHFISTIVYASDLLSSQNQAPPDSNKCQSALSMLPQLQLTYSLPQSLTNQIRSFPRSTVPQHQLLLLNSSFISNPLLKTQHLEESLRALEYLFTNAELLFKTFDERQLQQIYHSIQSEVIEQTLLFLLIEGVEFEATMSSDLSIEILISSNGQTHLNSMARYLNQSYSGLPLLITATPMEAIFRRFERQGPSLVLNPKEVIDFNPSSPTLVHELVHIENAATGQDYGLFRAIDNENLPLGPNFGYKQMQSFDEAEAYLRTAEKMIELGYLKSRVLKELNSAQLLLNRNRKLTLALQSDLLNNKIQILSINPIFEFGQRRNVITFRFKLDNQVILFLSVFQYQPKSKEDPYLLDLLQQNINLMLKKCDELERQYSQ